MNEINDNITLSMLQDYLDDCENPDPKDYPDQPTPRSIQPTINGFWLWAKKHNY